MIVQPWARVGRASDRGRVRTRNEDSCHVGRSLFVVADGMGGHAAGEVASRIAVGAMAEIADRADLTVADIVEQVHRANRRVLSSAARHPEQTGMGTTLAGLAVVTVGGSAHWAAFNVGDSRIYRFLDGHLHQVSVDHSEVGELVESGALTVEEAQHHPSRHVVTRIVGRDPLAPVDTWVFPPYPGERFVLCTDGLTNELDLPHIRIILESNPDPQTAAAILVQEAVRAGGRDNVTVVVVASAEGSSAATIDEDTTPRVRDVGGRT